jgi:hypothetical protein
MNGRLIVGFIIILVGIGLLLDLNIIQIIIPLFIIIIGIRIVMGRNDKWGWEEGGQTVVNEDNLKRVLVFSGTNQKIKSDDFKRAEIVTVFGGADIDLSEVKVKTENITLDFVAVFGGIKVKVPPNWDITSQGVGILGGFDNKTTPSSEKVKVTLKGTAILGGVEIGN